jgi:16S rRNA (adenine1518-N6/adenine1519-N6)-dimethyltransferase
VPLPLTPRKSLGQHFLRDQRISRKIVDAVAPLPGEVVLEIGPGEGALTALLIETGCRLILVDLDPRVVAVMQQRYGSSATVLHGDILDSDPAVLSAAHGVERLRVVGNIPYYITSPILFHFLDHRASVKDLTMMVQREVGRRIAAAPGSKEYGIVSVIAQFFADVTLLFDVQPGSFHPRPSVTSSVVRLTMRPEPRFPVSDEAFFRRVVRTTFGQRRKTLRNSLRGLGDVRLESIDERTLARRPEELSGEEFALLSNALSSDTGQRRSPRHAALAEDPS